MSMCEKNIFLNHFKLEIALAIPALNYEIMKYNINNAAGPA